MWRSAVPLLLVGASTGGPSALVKLFKGLGPEHPFGIVLIQHIDEKFSKGMAEWLQEQAGLPVVLFKSGIRLEAGKILLAGEGQNHVIIDSTGELVFSSIQEHASYKPSIDVLFSSAAKNWPYKGYAVLLTGMGEDGAKGMLDLYGADWETVAESKESCIVYGMPKAAIDKGAAKHILPVHEIGERLIKWHRERSKGGFHT